MIKIEFDMLSGVWSNVEDENDRYEQDGDFFLDRHNRLYQVEKIESEDVFIIKEVEVNKVYEVAIRCDLNEETYFYKMTAKNEEDALRKAKDEFCSEFLNIMTKEEYDEVFEGDEENE